MQITKETILAEATKLGITLNEEQIQKFITDKKLPDLEFKYQMRYESLEKEIEAGTKTAKDLLDLIKERDTEAGDRRKKNKALQDELDTIKEKQRLADEQKLKDEGKLQELLDAKEQELLKVKPFEEKYTALSEKLRNNQLTKIKPEFLEFAKTLTDEQLLSFTETHSVESPNPTHNGNTNGNAKRELTETEKKEMASMGFSEGGEKYYLEAVEARNKRKQT